MVLEGVHRLEFFNITDVVIMVVWCQEIIWRGNFKGKKMADNAGVGEARCLLIWDVMRKEEENEQEQKPDQGYE